MTEKKCVECGDTFEGRIDKIYCSPYCKSAWHYRKQKDQGQTKFKKIDQQLKLNRRLLKHFNHSGKSTIRAEKLHAAGFDPQYFTHYWRNKHGKAYIFCYDVGYLKLTEHDTAKYLIIDWQDYMNTPPGI